MYAVVKTGGKQYRVEIGDSILVEKIDANVGDKVQLDCLLTSDGKEVKVGSPLLDEKVEALVLEHGKGDKVIIFKYKAKKDYRKKQGHRQPYTKLEIVGIGATKATVAEDDSKEMPKDEVAVEEPEVVEEKKAEVKVSMSMKKEELLEVARENGVEVDAKATKAVIMEAIEEALK